MQWCDKEMYAMGFPEKFRNFFVISAVAWYFNLHSTATHFCGQVETLLQVTCETYIEPMKHRNQKTSPNHSLTRFY